VDFRRRGLIPVALADDPGRNRLTCRIIECDSDAIMLVTSIER
jgi:hypothetical protein